jgi:hypothetical protein
MPVSACWSTTIQSSSLAAIQLGHHGVALVRGGATALAPAPVISSLYELLSRLN